MRSAFVLICVVHACALSSSTESSENDAMPKSIGIVGVGTIGSALVRGILSAPIGHLPFVPTFVLSPRDADNSAALKKEFPNSARIAGSDQEVVDGADCVVLALPGSVAVQIIQTLKFRDEQQVISLIAAVKFPQLQALLGPKVDCTLAVPLPAIAKQQGATLGFPSKPFAEAIFSATGTYIAVSDEEQYGRMGVAGALMGDFYKHQLTVQQWMTSHGVEPSKAAGYIGAIFATIAADSADANPTTFAEKVLEQTPGGLNEMVWKQQEAAGVYKAVNKSLDSVYERHNKTTSDHTEDLQLI